MAINFQVYFCDLQSPRQRRSNEDFSADSRAPLDLGDGEIFEFYSTNNKELEQSRSSERKNAAASKMSQGAFRPQRYCFCFSEIALHNFLS